MNPQTKQAKADWLRSVVLLRATVVAQATPPYADPDSEQDQAFYEALERLRDSLEEWAQAKTDAMIDQVLDICLGAQDSTAPANREEH